MGVPKGTDNFKGFRAVRQQTSLALLKAELERARRRKMLYPDKTTLVTDMAERTNIHRTTLVRNPAYHREILLFLAGQAGASALVVDEDAPPELLRAKLIDAQIEIGALKEKLAALDRGGDVKSDGTPSLAGSASEAHSAFVDTVWAMRAVLDRVNSDGELFQIDLDKCEIRDLASEPSRRVVVSGRRLQPFLEALKTLQEQER